MKKHAPKKNHAKEHKHSPFFLLWELVTLVCVVFIAEVFFFPSLYHENDPIAHEVERWVVAAEIILVVEVALLILVARNKIHFIKKNWPTIFAVLPIGSGFRLVKIIKLGWHAFEKTKVGHFLEHPIQDSKKWFRKNLGLRV